MDGYIPLVNLHRILGVAQRTAYRWAKQGDLPTVGTRRKLVPILAIENIVGRLSASQIQSASSVPARPKAGASRHDHRQRA